MTGNIVSDLEDVLEELAMAIKIMGRVHPKEILWRKPGTTEWRGVDDVYGDLMTIRQQLVGGEPDEGAMN